MRLNIIKTWLLSVALAGALVLGGCTGADSGKSGKLEAVATFYPLEYLVQRIGGERVHVVSLVSPGTEPHEWEPTPRDVDKIRKSKLFVYHGAGLDPWAEKAAGDSTKDGPQIVRATEGLSIHTGPAEEGGGTEQDPHVWLDPQLYALQADLVAQGLAKADPEGATTYQANLAVLKKDLISLQADMKAGLSTCARDPFVTSHSAFSYLASRFGLTQVSVTGISPEQEPSPARLEQIIKEIRQEGATHIYFETLISPELSDTIAREAGIKTLVLNPVEGLTKEDVAAKKDYLSVMRDNLASLRIGLGCK